MATDISNCFAVSSGFGGFNRFDSGRLGVNWDNTGNGTERLIAKDNSGDFTAQSFYLEYLQIACSSGKVVLYDGSGGIQIAGVAVGDTSSGYGGTQAWDFKDDPLVTLSAESTQALCISAGQGQTTGFVKGYWGR